MYTKYESLLEKKRVWLVVVDFLFVVVLDLVIINEALASVLFVQVSPAACQPVPTTTNRGA